VSAAIEVSALTKTFGTAWSRAGRRRRIWPATVTPQFHRSRGAVNDEIGPWFKGSRTPSDPSSDLAFAVHCEDE